MASTEVSEKLISIRVQMLAAIFSRKLSDDAIAVFQRVLLHFPEGVLKKAFTNAETSLDKMPTPKVLAQMCGEVMPSRAWRYNFQPAKGDVLIDPDPDCDVCRKPQSEHPTNTCGFVDERNARAMYRAEDCEEGRDFLALLRKIAQERTLRTVDVETSRANLQAQKMAILKLYPSGTSGP